MSIYQKNKGKKFENQVADILHKYFYNNNNEYRRLYNFLGNKQLKPYRDLSSGTLKDVSTSDIQLNLLYKFFPFSIECKFWKEFKDLNLNNLLKEKVSQLFNIFEKQVKPVAVKSNLIPLLVFKGNYTNIFCMYEKCDDLIYLDFKNYVFLRQKYKIVLFNDFIKEYNEKINK